MEAIDRQSLEEIAAWASRHGQVRRVWVIGSRARGTARADSDLDIAIELTPVADSEETMPEWVAHAEAWRAELQRRLRPTVDLKWVDADHGSRDTRAAAAEGKLLAYERVPG
jgi:predicted nucleotidyltransferase